MFYRRYERSDDMLSVIGCGAIVLMGNDQRRADRIIAESVDVGVSYFDVAPSYGDGEAETLLGPALEPYRKRRFLACKSGCRDAKQGSLEFFRSLKRLRTDWFDLYQLHALHDLEDDVEAAFATGGIMEFLIERKKAGDIRHIGFSAHTQEAALRALELYDFDSVLFPLNYGSKLTGGFGNNILKATAERSISALALKGMAHQRWADGDTRREGSKCWYEPLEDERLMQLALRWTLNQPITAMIPPGEEKQYRFALEHVESAREPLGDEELAELTQEAKGLRTLFPLD